MKIYKDVISGDEMGSDSYPMEVEDDVVYKFQTKLITKSDGNFDMAGDGAGETYDDSAVTVNNFVDALRLQETQFSKSSFMTYIKGYMQALKKHLEENNPDRVKDFMKGAQVFVKKVIGSFSEFQFFTGESMNPDGMIALMRYMDNAEGEQLPYIYLFKDGLEEEKV